jgi:hypothetical protein
MDMTKSETANRYSPEVRARAVGMVAEHQGCCDNALAERSMVSANLSWPIVRGMSRLMLKFE